MGWRGTVRSLVAISNRIERDSRRRQKLLMQQEKQLTKVRQLEKASFEVEKYENYIEVITSIHKECHDCVNWANVLLTSEPIKPQKKTENEDRARDKLVSYRPGFFDRLFKRQEKKVAGLQSALEKAIKQDCFSFEQDQDDYEKKFSEWQELIKVARGVINGQPQFYKQAYEELSPLEEISIFANNLNVHFISKTSATVDFNISSEQVIPREQKVLLKSGKLSVKQLPVSRYHQLYQDFVCGIVLRIARELFAILPIMKMTVNAKSELLDTSTGLSGAKTVLSVLFMRETIDKINFVALDPSDSLKNFMHNMNFRKTAGFAEVEEIELTDSLRDYRVP